jgi:hypothetical protein
MSKAAIPEPWCSFLSEVDAFIIDETHLHCLGGFVVKFLYGYKRETSDIDFLTLVGRTDDLIEFAGERSDLAGRFGVYLDPVGVAPTPEDYEERLVEMFPGTLDKLRLWALDPYDIVLTKLERNTSIDRQDVQHLAETVPLDLDILRQRYLDEFRVYVKNERREDQTLDLWIEMIEERREN